MRYRAMISVTAVSLVLFSAAAWAQQAAPAQQTVKAVTEAPVRFDVNKATFEDLVAVPGIGPKTARMILDLRTKRGSFATLEDLLEVKGIGEKSLEKLRVHLFVSPPQAAALKKNEKPDR